MRKVRWKALLSRGFSLDHACPQQLARSGFWLESRLSGLSAGSTYSASTQQSGPDPAQASLGFRPCCICSTIQKQKQSNAEAWQHARRQPGNVRSRDQQSSCRVYHSGSSGQIHSREQAAQSRQQLHPYGQALSRYSNRSRICTLLGRLRQASFSSLASRPFSVGRSALAEAYVPLALKDEVRLVERDGSHRVITYGQALDIAKRASADLMFVARQATPPVVKVGDAGRVHFEKKLLEKEQRRKQLEMRKASTMKEVRVGFKIAENDLKRQLNLARGFLEKGLKVKVVVTHRRKETREGKLKLQDVKDRVADWATAQIVAKPGVEFQQTAMILSQKL